MTGWWLASYLGLWVVVLLLGVGFSLLMRQLGMVHIALGGPRGARLRMEGPAVGSVLAAAPVRELRGDDVVAGSLEPQPNPQLMVFSSPSCSLCELVLPSLPSIVRNWRDHDLTATIVLTEDPRGYSVSYGAMFRRVRTVWGMDVMKKFSVPSYPFAIVLDPSFRVLAQGTVNDGGQIESLLSSGLAAHQGRHPLIQVGPDPVGTEPSRQP
jgi:methylamine dehydrogenase accessory protein MauD